MFHATGGNGPLNAVITPLLAVFGQAFHNFKLGYASTQAYVYFLFNICGRITTIEII